MRERDKEMREGAQEGDEAAMQHVLKTGKKDLPHKGADQKDFQIHYALLSEEMKEKTNAHLVIKSDEIRWRKTLDLFHVQAASAA
ncbi:TPA: hypothetical protein ACH3X1_015681 [Trebouxia sp. C0004]